MFIQAQKERSRVVTNVNTRSQTKYVFKTATKIGRKYEFQLVFRYSSLEWFG